MVSRMGNSCVSHQGMFCDNTEVSLWDWIAHNRELSLTGYGGGEPVLLTYPIVGDQGNPSQGGKQDGEGSCYAKKNS